MVEPWMTTPACRGVAGHRGVVRRCDKGMCRYCARTCGRWRCGVGGVVGWGAAWFAFAWEEIWLSSTIGWQPLQSTSPQSAPSRIVLASTRKLPPSATRTPAPLLEWIAEEGERKRKGNW